MARHQRSRPSQALKCTIMSRFTGSGLSVDAFCRQESISTSSFYRWRSLLGDAPPGEGLTRKALSATPRASGFVDLGLLRSSDAPLELHLDLGGGLLLHLVRG